MRDVRLRARAARELIHSTRGSERMALMAFMAIFHPDKQAQVDRPEGGKRKRPRSPGIQSEYTEAVSINLPPSST